LSPVTVYNLLRLYCPKPIVAGSQRIITQR